MKATDKTNVMRLLEQKKVAYQHYTYESEGAITGVHTPMHSASISDEF